MPNDIERYLEELKEVRFKKEPLLESDTFNNPVYREGLESLAQVIQNIIIIEKGTYPNQPDLGVGISKYMFELLDQNTLSDIKVDIESQVEYFITHPNITVNVNVQKIESMNKIKSNTIAISVILNNTITNSTVQLDYLFAGNNKNKRIVSKLYYS